MINLAKCLCGPLVMMTVGWTAMTMPGVPYNIRELFAGNHPLLTLLVLVITLYWSFGIPIWLTLWFRKEFRLATAFLPCAAIHGLVAYGLLRISIPMESIHDIVGSPILSWPWEWELMGRFLALFAVPSLMATGGALAAIMTHAGRHSLRFLWHWVGIAVTLLPILHWVVVRRAATDNLTELMAGGGGWFATVLLCAWLFIIFFAASGVSARMAGNIRQTFFAILLVILLSLPLGYFVLRLGAANEISKYGQKFSALQFLLSPDRLHYVGERILVLRYALCHILAIGMIALAQYPFWVSIADRSGQSRPK